jgi:hypothetical protein
MLPATSYEGRGNRMGEPVCPAARLDGVNMTSLMARVVGPSGAGLRDILPRPQAFLQRVRAGVTGGEAELLLRQLYGLWLLALLGKALGSSWDVSWHFKWLRDDLAPPHLINVGGDAIMIALVVFHTITGFGVDKAALRLMQAGSLLFLLSVPADVINHRLNGLDITSWSFTHAGLYTGTALAIAGAIRGWTTQSRALPERAPVLAVLWVFFFENLLFPNQQQEYGVLAVRAFANGNPTAEPILLRFAANQAGVNVIDLALLRRFSLPIPDWVYLTWAAGAAMLVLVLARRSVGWRFTATAVAGTYLAYRCVMWLLLAGVGFPKSTVPFLLLGGALAIDLVCLAGLAWPVEAVLGAVAVTAAIYGAAYVQAAVLAAPPVDYGSIGWAMLALTGGWLVAGALWARLATPVTSPPVAAPAGS